METQTPSTSANAAQLALIQKKLVLDNKIRGGADWFFWIAGLSLINTIAYLLGKNFAFFVGLGITQIVDGLTSVLARRLSSGGSIVYIVGFVIDASIAGIFVALGVFGRKRFRAPIIIGMILYALDGVILLLFQDFLGAGFHAFALFGIWNGLKSISELANLEKDGNSESIESIRKRVPSLQPPVLRPPLTLQQRMKRWLVVGIFLLAIVLFFVINSFQH